MSSVMGLSSAVIPRRFSGDGGAHETVHSRYYAGGDSCRRRLAAHRTSPRTRRHPVERQDHHGRRTLHPSLKRWRFAATALSPVGSDGEIAKLAGPQTRRIDLRGRAVIPGLIDNHMHLLRAGTTWQWECAGTVWVLGPPRSRASARALKLLHRANGSTPGGMGNRAFRRRLEAVTREELDKVAPDNPVFLQASYYEAYLNSRALQQLRSTRSHQTGPCATPRGSRPAAH